MTATISEARAAVYEIEVKIEAPRETVWKSLVDETNTWWLPDFHMAGAGSTVTLEARAGGHLIETHESGASLLWFTVTNCVPGVQLDATGGLSPQYGGPATTMITLKLEEAEGGGTTLRLTDALFGRVPEETLRSLEEGWKLLFIDGLKKFAEGK